MATYAVTIDRAAQKSLNKIERPTRKRIDTTIAGLASDPRPHGCAKLTDADAYRIWVGDYRVVYTVNDTVRVVEVANIGHRSSIYREA